MIHGVMNVTCLPLPPLFYPIDFKTSSSISVCIIMYYFEVYIANLICRHSFHFLKPSRTKLEPQVQQQFAPHQIQQQLAPHQMVQPRHAVQPSKVQQASPELQRTPVMPSVQQVEKLQPLTSNATTNTSAVEEKKRHEQLPVRAYLDQTVVPLIVVRNELVC